MNGFQLIETLHLIDRRQVRFPKSRKRRIRKKWRQRESSWRSVPRMELLVDEARRVIYGHPLALERLRIEAARRTPAQPWANPGHSAMDDMRAFYDIKATRPKPEAMSVIWGSDV